MDPMKKQNLEKPRKNASSRLPSATQFVTVATQIHPPSVTGPIAEKPE